MANSNFFILSSFVLVRVSVDRPTDVLGVVIYVSRCAPNRHLAAVPIVVRAAQSKLGVPLAGADLPALLFRILDNRFKLLLGMPIPSHIGLTLTRLSVDVCQQRLVPEPRGYS
jgi:hypothetical protein